MSALVDVASSLLTAARGIIAAFGCLCVVIHAVIPCLVAVGEFVVYELPIEIANWQLQKAQQSELRALEDRVARLKKRRARQNREEALRAHEDYQMQASRRQEALRRKQKESEQEKRRMVEEEKEKAVEERPRAEERGASRQSTASFPARPEVGKTLIPKPRLSRPLGLLSPNIPIDRRPVSAYVKASAGVTKPVADSDRARRAAASKARILSLGSVFDEGENENPASVPRMWAQ